MAVMSTSIVSPISAQPPSVQRADSSSSTSAARVTGSAPAVGAGSGYAPQSSAISAQMGPFSP